MSTNSAAISIQPSHFILNKPCSLTISWDDGKEIRIYHVGPGNVLQEYAYSAGKGRNSWHQGDLHNLNIVVDPTSPLTAIRYQRGSINVFYQDGDAIRSLYKYGPGQLWMRGQTNIKAAKGSSIAIIERFDANGQAPSQNHIFLQDPELRLREYLFDRSARQWVLGTFNPGVQPRGTPISAEVIQGGDVDINVMWRDAHGRVASSSWSKSSGWDL